MPYLFERLAAPVRTADGRVEPFDEQAAVAAQIQRIVASRNVPLGAAEAVVPWGLPNAVELGHHSETELSQFAEQARRLIARHEPRLVNVRVSIEAQDDVLNPYRLIVSGLLSKAPCEISVALAG